MTIEATCAAVRFFNANKSNHQPKLTFNAILQPSMVWEVASAPSFTYRSNVCLLFFNFIFKYFQLYLSIPVPPQFVYGYFESRTVKLGDTIVLTCLVKVEHINDVTKNQSMEQILMRWFKDDTISDQNKDDRYHITNTFEVLEKSVTLANYSLTFDPNIRYYATKLTIRHVSRVDTGVYLCTAQNPYGFIRKNFTITVLESPDKPIDVRGDEVTSTSIKLGWLVPFDGNSPITEYLISYRNIIGSVPTTVTVSPYSYATTVTGHPINKFIIFQLSSLTPNTAYIIQIKAKNSVGYGSFSDTLTVKTAEERKDFLTLTKL